MDFKQFKGIFQENLDMLLKEQDYLFITDVSREEIWKAYIDNFPDGTNKIFRERGEFDCSCCRSFLYQFGNIVTIKNNKVMTIWDFETNDKTYQPVINALAKLVKDTKIKDVFVTKQEKFGTDYNLEQLKNVNLIQRWEHFYTQLPKRFITSSTKSVGDLMGDFRDKRNVFERSLNELTSDSLQMVLDLIDEKTLYKGDEWLGTLTEFQRLQNEYHLLPDNQRNNYCWIISTKISGAIAKIRNHSIGVLLRDISNGKDITKAVERYETVIVPPHSYKRPKTVYTKRQVEDAENFVKKEGLADSLDRRYATIEDVTINNVLWANKDAIKAMDGLGIFEALKQEVTIGPKKFDKVKGIGIDVFIADILPMAKDIQILLENKHQKNLISLIAPEVKDSPTLFKWDNCFSWAYNGNVTDSLMKQRVKMAGGKIDGVLRFSLQWNDDNEFNPNDFDAHCIEPSDNHIYFSNKGMIHASSGILDVDIINPIKGKSAVENITWKSIDDMQEGVYKMFVKNYNHMGGVSGFKAEIEFDGQIYEYSYSKELAQDEEVIVAKLEFSRKDGIKFIKTLPLNTNSKTVWGLKTNQFHPVSICTYSPNYWDEQKGIGHKHLFFMLAGAKNNTQPNGFFNEYLKQDFMAYKKVFAALGNKMKVEHSDNQLSGLGFSSTKRNNLIAKVDNKIMKIIF